MYILLIAYLTGFAFAFIMQRTEVAAEKTPYTFGIRLLIIATSLLSWLMVVIVLVKAWLDYIKNFGYWDELVEPGPLPEVEYKATKAQTN